MEGTSKPAITGMLASLGLATGLGAVFAASCCVVPMALGSLGAGMGVFAALEALASYRSAILIASVALVAIAWGFYFRRRGAARTAVVLCLASGVVVAAASWDAALEAPLLKLIIRASR